MTAGTVVTAGGEHTRKGETPFFTRYNNLWSAGSSRKTKCFFVAAICPNSE